ncbi:fungal-specific transcription factor domain-containing protein [Annulohypoxylon truncatum]|uniref:fungal-specific transcription factor domain-containing protein n=1 Tax=Annulohypoxylon truncatum TaxID=327061 RepID=UPI0020088731|nr:fungal-specific transcription factor domain-containing protein [Annulohypoxylon truncatum]KAI1206326.1 fungal-specific transcription factor domain-containing protein [Annulohypoxylon truncatum]
MEMNCTTGENTKPFSCPACPSRFTRQENLNRHTASVHRKSNRRPFPCPQCDVSFSRSDLRKRHIRKAHGQQVAAEQTSQNGAHQTEFMSPSQGNLQPAQLCQIDPTAVGEKSYSQTPRGDTTLTPASDVFSLQNISWLFRLPQFVTAFFERFYPSFPAIHQPTFDVTIAKEPMLQAVACVGAMYHSPGSNYNISLALFEAGLRSLDKYVREDRSRFREIWVTQAYLLFEYFAFYSCRDDLFPTAIRIHRRVVDSARQYQLLQDGSLSGGYGSGLSPAQNDIHVTSPSSEQAWKQFIESESRKRTMYCLYYLDAQLSVCCNVRPLLTALEVKYELPCRDDVWSAPTETAWSMLTQAPEFSFNEEDDVDANGEPRPAHGDLYETLMHLMNPDPTARPLGLLWYSSFASLMLVIQILMMTRELTLGSTFLYNNVRCNDTRHGLSIIMEANRAPIMQALNNLAELMPKPSSRTWPIVAGSDPIIAHTGAALWHPVWMAWYYTVISLTHQDALLTSGIVEYSLPTAISTAWELGKPRAKAHRDIYEDRDVVRVADNLEYVINILTTPPMGSVMRDSIGTTNGSPCIEDPFVTMLGFKACMMGWRVIRLMVLGLEQPLIHGSEILRPNIYSVSAQVVLAKVMEALSTGCGGSPQGFEKGPFNDVYRDELGTISATEAKYLEWMERTFAMRDVWPLGEWVVAVFNETREEGT